MSEATMIHPAYRSLNKPLTICGVERRLFFMALVMGSGTLNFFGSFVAGLAMFAALYAFSRWATHRDPQLLRILLNSSKFKARYDPGKPGELVVLGERP